MRARRVLQIILAELQWSQRACHATGAHGLCASQSGWHRRHGLHWRGVQAGHWRLHLSQVALLPPCSSRHGGSLPDMQVTLGSSLLPCCWRPVKWRLTAVTNSCHRLLRPCTGADASKRCWLCAAQCAVSTLQTALQALGCLCHLAGATLQVQSACGRAALQLPHLRADACVVASPGALLPPPVPRAGVLRGPADRAGSHEGGERDCLRLLPSALILL